MSSAPPATIAAALPRRRGCVPNAIAERPEASLCISVVFGPRSPYSRPHLDAGAVRPQDDPDVVIAFGSMGNAGVIEGVAGGGNGDAANRVDAAHLHRRQVFRRIEVADAGGVRGAQAGDVELRNGPDALLPGQQRPRELLARAAEARDAPNPADDHTAAHDAYVTMLSMRAQHAGIAAILAIAVTVAAAVAAVVDAAPKGDLFDEIYQRSLPMASTLKSIRARFTETTTSSLLAKPLVAEGTLVAVRPTDLLI